MMIGVVNKVDVLIAQNRKQPLHMSGACEINKVGSLSRKQKMDIRKSNII